MAIASTNKLKGFMDLILRNLSGQTPPNQHVMQ